MYGLVLEGGGAKGAYQIGVWKALRELGIEIKGVVGTSVGALNGAMIIQDDFDKAYELWSEITPSKVIKIDDELVDKFKNLDIKSEDIRYLLKHLKVFIGDKGIDISPLKELLKVNINEDIIRQSNKDFGIVTISLTDMKPMELYIEDIPKGKLINYLIASSSLPVFKREKLDGKFFLDGGFYNNLPANLLISKGYKDLIMVRLNSMGRIPKVNEDGLNIINIKPIEDLGRVLDFSGNRARRNIKLGYFDTLKVLQGLKGIKYYINLEQEKDYFKEHLLNLSEATVNKIGEILGIHEKIPYRRKLFEHIIPRLIELLDIDKNSSYEDIIVSLYEIAAERYDIERFKVYTLEEFKDNILEKFIDTNTSNYREIPSIFKQSDLIVKAFRKDILNKIVDELLNSEKSWATNI
ncbi:patatin-like phospholipase family protein [Caldisalinibacter kiritimatiensis]|uniref:Ferredoxin reductase n=1 Tax=Caldisalinibacter kiritimatiensis TaxID=1304284 RepID=R1AX25_9FIRM|nr:patatin-like phospholipase family protein [Caldisalinibacter kiritimatiensis]EOD01217.1 Ferredoxin reductase [Caldisalinibacter kiritimatiensis]